jgi:hypothetical protein
MHIQLPEDLGRVQKMRVVNNPMFGQHQLQVLFPMLRLYALLDIVSKERQVEDQRKPVSVDQEQEGEESVDGDFGNDVRVQAVAEVDGVDVVATRTNALASHRMNGSERRQQRRDVAESLSNYCRPPRTPPPEAHHHCLLLSEDSVPFQIAVHDGEEHLEEEVDRIYDDGEQV